MTVPVGWYTFLHDFLDGGVERWADEVARSGADHVNVATVYHTARDVLPRNPSRRVRFMNGGTHYFAPHRALYPDDAQPAVDREIEDDDPLPGVIRQLDERGISTNAWAVFLHNSRLAHARPALAQRNAFGDAMKTDLCPSNPVVRHYAVALAQDISRLSPGVLLAESLHFHGLRHGYHHERYLFELGNLAELALSLCFCSHCLDRAQAGGVDAHAVQDWARATAESAFAGSPVDVGAELSREAATEAATAALAAYLQCRDATVTSLIADVAAAVASAGSRLALLDPSGAVKGWADGLTSGGPVAEGGWVFGLDIQQIAPLVEAVEVLGYTASPDRLAEDLAHYRDLVGGTPLRLSMRPAPPDAAESTNLTQKLAAAEEFGVEAVDLYHLGLLPPTAVDRVAAAIRQATSGGTP